MASKTVLLPLGTDIAMNGSGTLESYVSNMIPTIIGTDVGGKKQLRWTARSAYDQLLVSSAANYQFSHAIQWTNVLGTGTNPSTARGVIVYSADDPGVDLKLYQWDSSETTLGTFATANYRCIGIQETLISGTANLTLAVRKTSASYDQKLLFFPNGGALTEVVDADFPASTFIGNPVHIGGYCFVASTDGYIYNSDINSLSSWTANNRIAAQETPDTLVGLARMSDNRIYVLGTKSIEIFANTGTNPSGSPLQRVPNSALKMGVLHQLAAQEFEGGLFCVATSEDGIGVYIVNGASAQKVSIPYIDNLLKTYAGYAVNSPLRGGTYSNVSTPAGEIQCAGVVDQHGMKLLTLFIHTDTYAYIPSADRWIVYNRVGISDRFFSAGGIQYMMRRPDASVGQSILWQSTPLSLALSDYNLSSSAIMLFITRPLSLGTAKRKFYESIRVVGPNASGTTMSILAYDDDSASSINLGTIDLSANPKQLFRLGSSRKRSWYFSFSGTTAPSIDGVELTYSEAIN
jgi:hypothetical protein